MDLDINELSKQLEALLYWNGGMVSSTFIKNNLQINDEQFNRVLIYLRDNVLKDRGVEVYVYNGYCCLRTSSSTSDLIKKLSKNNKTPELSDAAIQTITIILYLSPITKQDIEYIRGVDSSRIIRKLITRGLIEKNKKGEYGPTAELLGYLGLDSVEDLEEYSIIRQNLTKILEENNKDD